MYMYSSAPSSWDIHTGAHGLGGGQKSQKSKFELAQKLIPYSWFH